MQVMVVMQKVKPKAQSFSPILSHLFTLPIPATPSALGLRPTSELDDIGWRNLKIHPSPDALLLGMRKLRLTDI